MENAYPLFLILAVGVTSTIEKIIPNRPGIGLVAPPSMFLGMAVGVSYYGRIGLATFWAAVGMVIILYHRYKSLHSDDSDTL